MLTDLYAVVGNPISHSLSPQIHTAFAMQTKQNLVYKKKQVNDETFNTFVDSFFAEGGKGLNVTVPFKETAWKIAEQYSEDAKLAKAVNTLYKVEGTLVGANTDGRGLVRDIKNNHQYALENKRVLILGAGGAVRGVLGSLLENMPSTIVIANRTLYRAQQLQQDIIEQRPNSINVISCRDFSEIISPDFDIIINGTAASLHDQVLPLTPKILMNNPICYDMFYSANITVFNQWAISHGVSDDRAIDGLGMLVEQAAEAFLLWRKEVKREQLNTKLVIDELRVALN